MHRQHGRLQPLTDNASEKQPHTSKGLLRCLQILFSTGTASDSAGVLSVIGNGIFKCFKIADNNLKLLTSALTKHEPLNYTAHAWVMDGALAVVTGVVSSLTRLLGSQHGAAPCLGRLAAVLQPVADRLSGCVTWAALAGLAWETLPSNKCCCHAICTGLLLPSPCLASCPKA